MSTILIIDDSPSQRAEIRQVLEASGDYDRILEANDGLSGLQRLLAEAIDVVLCDLEMPGLDGEKLLHAKRCRPDGDDIPFVLLTANRDRDRIARLLRAGASDAITKPFHPADLVARLDLHLKVKRLQAELREKNAMLARLSATDAVTELRTRRYVSELLSVEYLRAARYGTPLTILMADIDHFKSVNDQYGHQAGDAVLRGVAEVMQSVMRVTDVGGRYGGEEFLILMPQTKLAGGVALAERLRAKVEAAAFETPAGTGVRVTISIGVAAHHPRIASADALLAEADAALYRAKAAGRNRVVSAVPSGPEAG